MLQVQLGGGRQSSCEPYRGPNILVCSAVYVTESVHRYNTGMKAKMIAVDATKEVALAKEYKADAYPTIWFVKDGHREEYIGERKVHY